MILIFNFFSYLSTLRLVFSDLNHTPYAVAITILFPSFKVMLTNNLFTGLEIKKFNNVINSIFIFSLFLQDSPIRGVRHFPELCRQPHTHLIWPTIAVHRRFSIRTSPTFSRTTVRPLKWFNRLLTPTQVIIIIIIIVT